MRIHGTGRRRPNGGRDRPRRSAGGARQRSAPASIRRATTRRPEVAAALDRSRRSIDASADAVDRGGGRRSRPARATEHAQQSAGAAPTRRGCRPPEGPAWAGSAGRAGTRTRSGTGRRHGHLDDDGDRARASAAGSGSSRDRLCAAAIEERRDVLPGPRARRRGTPLAVGVRHVVGTLEQGVERVAVDPLVLDEVGGDPAQRAPCCRSGSDSAWA